MSAKEIIAYIASFKIEESFKVIKSNLGGEPVYADDDWIEGHFLTCFIASVLLITPKYKMKDKYLGGQIK